MKRLLLVVVALLFSAVALAAVNINTATKEELDALPGIGPVKAQAIIDYRTANGPFKTPEDIMKVKGIKEGEFGKLKGEISVSGPSVPAVKAAPAAPATVSAPAKPAMAPAARMAAPAAPAVPAKVESAKTPAAPIPPAPAKADAMNDTAKTGADKTKGAKASKEADGTAATDKSKEEKAAKDKAAKEDKEAKAKAAKEQKAKDEKASGTKPAKDDATKK
jgi:competence protein ComEA